MARRGTIKPRGGYSFGPVFCAGRANIPRMAGWSAVVRCDRAGHAWQIGNRWSGRQVGGCRYGRQLSTVGWPDMWRLERGVQEVHQGHVCMRGVVRCAVPLCVGGEVDVKDAGGLTGTSECATHVPCTVYGTVHFAWTLRVRMGVGWVWSWRVKGGRRRDWVRAVGGCVATVEQLWAAGVSSADAAAARDAATIYYALWSSVHSKAVSLGTP